MRGKHERRPRPGRRRVKRVMRMRRRERRRRIGRARGTGMVGGICWCLVAYRSLCGGLVGVRWVERVELGVEDTSCLMVASSLIDIVTSKESYNATWFRSPHAGDPIIPIE